MHSGGVSVQDIRNPWKRFGLGRRILRGSVVDNQIR